MKFATPGQLLICLVLFFLPWIEIQCPVPDLGNMKIGEIQKDPQKKPSIKDMTYSGFLTQSGFQAATGGYTISDPTMRQMVESSKKMAKEMGGKAGGAKAEDEIKSAPLLFLYPLAAIAGIIIGFVLPGGGAKKGMLIGCCALVLVAAGGQAAMGFPVEKDIKEQQSKKGGGGAGAMNAELGGDVLKTVYKFPFFLALLFAVGGIVTAVLEPAGTGKGKKKSKYDFDDEEDDDDDRPARSRGAKGSRDRDEDEEEEDDDRDRKRDKGKGGKGGDNPFSNMD